MRSPPGSTAGRRRSRRGPAFAVSAILVVVLAVAIGARFVPSWITGWSASPAASEPPATIIPLEEIPWPSIPPDLQEQWQGGRRGLARATALLRSGNRRQADRLMWKGLLLLREAGALVPELGPYHLRTVESVLTADPSAAVKRTQRWLALFPRDFHHLLAAGKALYHQHKWREAATYMRAATEVWPASVESRYWLAEICFQMGAREEAIRTTDAILDLVGFPSTRVWDRPGGERPESKDIIGNSIKVLHRFLAFERLEKVARFYRTTYPSRMSDELRQEIAMAEGAALVHLGRYAEAEQHLRLARANAGNREEVQFTLGLAAAKQGQWRDAAGAFGELLSENPYFARAYYQLALCLSRIGRRQEARLFFERSQELAPSERELRRALEQKGVGRPGRAAATESRAYSMRGQFQEAEKALRKPHLKQEPAAVLALADLYLSFLRCGMAQRVLAHAATLLGPQQADVLAYQARLQLLRGETASAFVTLRRVAEAPGASDQRSIELGKRLVEAQRSAEAIKVLESVRRSPADREASYLLCRAHYAEGQYEKALEMIRSVSTGDTRFAKWEGPVWLAAAILKGGGGTDTEYKEAARLLDAVKPSRRHSRIYLEAQAALLEATGTGSDRASLAAKRERFEEEAARQKVLRRRIARSAWPQTAPLYVELASSCRRQGDLARAARWGRLVINTPAGAGFMLAECYPRPADVYFRLDALRSFLKHASGSGEAAARAAAEIESLEARYVRFE